ncbi:uncharacterized protein TrAtP1_002643 [Trichoderma atroviride]|uniref:uncharacterized protein n=1 Tax=Hypocrea atroviridis TaxID=63577 RepID=UPI00331799F7|nr:hypothetical protein TrAtP1_002643 [Trichoderma atroviride]
MTYGFYGKKGHDKSYYYTKRNGKKSKTTKDKSSKDGSGYYPKKTQAKKTHKIARINTLNFRDQVLSEKEDLD